MFNNISTIFFVLYTALGFVLPTLFTLLVDVLAVTAPVLAVARDTVLGLASYAHGVHAKPKKLSIGDIGTLLSGALRSCKSFTTTLVRLATQCLRGHLLSTPEVAHQYAADIYTVVTCSTMRTSALLLGFTLTALEDAYDVYQTFGVLDITASELSASSAWASTMGLSDAILPVGPRLNPAAKESVPRAAVGVSALDAPVKLSMLNAAASPFVPRGMDTLSLPSVLNPFAAPFVPAQSPPNPAAAPDDLTPVLDVLNKPSMLNPAALVFVPRMVSTLPSALTLSATSAPSSLNLHAAPFIPKSAVPEPVPQFSACELELLAHVMPFPSSRSFNLFPLPTSAPLQHSVSFASLRSPASLVASPTCPAFIPGHEAWDGSSVSSGSDLEEDPDTAVEEGREDSWGPDANEESEELLSAPLSRHVFRICL